MPFSLWDIPLMGVRAPLAGMGALQRLWNEPSLTNFITNTPTRYGNLEQKLMQDNPNSPQNEGLSRAQAEAFSQMGNRGFFENINEGYKGLANQGMETLYNTPGQILGSGVRSLMGNFNQPNQQQMTGMGGYDPGATRYRSLQELAQSFEQNQGLPSMYGSLGKFGGSFFGSGASATGSMLGGQFGRSFSSLNPFGSMPMPYQPNYQREFGVAGGPQRYWDIRNRNLNPMQRGY